MKTPMIALHRYLNKGFILILIFAFILSSLAPIPAGAADLPAGRQGLQHLQLPTPGTRVSLSPEFNPPILKGIKVHPDNPFRFEFILDKGDSSVATLPQNDDQLKQESTRLIKYFLASITTSEKDLWVNLSPYEKDRIIPNNFGLTEMGRDLLAQDYMLKQITASLIYPEDEVGRKFWKRIYEEAAKKYGTTNIPVNTFNKVWIVPEKAVVYENAKASTAYVVESKLKVMLEEDYLSLQKHHDALVHHKGGGTNQLGSQIIREIVLPELTKEINAGRNFSQLRQVYNSLILAQWYKKKIKDSILAKVYADKNKTAGIQYASSIIPAKAGIQNYGSPIKTFGDDTDNDVEAIYRQYLLAFKKGVYNYIKEEPDPITQEIIPKKYFSGGFDFSMQAKDTQGLSISDQGLLQVLTRDSLGVQERQVLSQDQGSGSLRSIDLQIEPATDESMKAEVEIQQILKHSRSMINTSDTDSVTASLRSHAMKQKKLFVSLTLQNQEELEQALNETYIDATGQVRTRPGILQRILTQGGIVLIDYNGSNPKIIEPLNSLFDDRPYLGDITIPTALRDHVKIVGVISKKNMERISSAFGDRFRQAKTPSKKNLLLPKVWEEGRFRGVVVDAWEASDLENELIGGYALTDGRLAPIEGKIISAIRQGKPLLIRGAIWKDPSGQLTRTGRMIAKIMTERSVSFNGQTEELPDDFQIYQQPLGDVTQEVVNKQIVPMTNKDDNSGEHVWIINRATQDLLFSITHVNETTNQVSVNPPNAQALLLRAKVRLRITEKLDNPTWHKMMHARGAITIELMPGMYVPAAYRKFVQGRLQGVKPSIKEVAWSDQVLQKNQVTVVETSDFSYALKKIQEASPEEVYVQPLTPETTGDDLTSTMIKDKDALGHDIYLLRKKKVIEELRLGHTVVLEGGEFSESLLKDIEGIFAPQPYLMNNGVAQTFPGRLVVVIKTAHFLPASVTEKIVLKPSFDDLRAVLEKEFPTEFLSKLWGQITAFKAALDSLGSSAPPVGLDQLRKFLKYKDLEEGASVSFEGDYYEHPEALAFVRLVIRVIFGKDKSPSSINGEALLDQLNNMAYIQWDNRFWQLAQTMNRTALMEAYGKEALSFHHRPSSLLKILQKVLIKNVEKRKRFNSRRFGIKSTESFEGLPQWDSPVGQGRDERYSTRIIQALRTLGMVMLIGPPGEGKSRAARLTAQEMGFKDHEVFGPMTVGPDSKEEDVLERDQMREGRNVHVLEEIGRWIQAPRGILMVDEANLPKEAFWNFLQGKIPKDHYVIFTGNNYSLQGRRHQEFIDRFMPTIIFEPMTRAEFREIMIKEEYIPSGIDPNHRLKDLLLDIHFVMERMKGAGTFSLRDIQQAVIATMIALGKGEGPPREVIIQAAWSVYEGHLTREEKFALMNYLKMKYNVNVDREGKLRLQKGLSLNNPISLQPPPMHAWPKKSGNF